MELVAKETYHNTFGSLFAGDTTIGMEIPEDVKKKMLEDFPEVFEVVPAKSTKVVNVIETPEDSLEIETPEAKMGKTRKK